MANPAAFSSTALGREILSALGEKIETRSPDNVNNLLARAQYTPYFQLLTLFEQSIFGNSYASNVKAYFQLLTLFQKS